MTVVAVICFVLFTQSALALGECAQVNANVLLTLESGLTKAARAAGFVQCLAVNGVISYEGSYAGSLRIRQINPAIDYVTPIQGTGEANFSLQAPANYDAKTCYQAFISAVSGFQSGSNQSAEACTPDPPPPPPTDPVNLYEDSDCPAYQNCHSPLVLNLGGGVYQLSTKSDPVLFDIDASGRPLRIAWTAPNSPMGFLALDRDHNGRIDDGSELFGNHTPLGDGTSARNGFEALMGYDANHDGVVDARDAIWASLLLWTDVNHDGVSQTAELIPMSASGVSAIGLDYHWTGRRDASGNTFRYESKVWISNGRRDTPRPVYDIFFVSVP